MTRRTRQTRTTARPRPSRHGKAHCLSILRRLSEYLDQELSSSVCDEIRRHLGVCPNCETFVASLQQTVSLCRHAPSPSLSGSAKAEMKRRILEASRRGC